MVISVTEGDDKPMKYPHMFAAADLVVVNKTDLLPYVDFDVDRLVEQARSLNPGVEVLPLVRAHRREPRHLAGLARAARQGADRHLTRREEHHVEQPVASVRRASGSTTLLDELGQSAVPAVMERVEELLRSA